VEEHLFLTYIVEVEFTRVKFMMHLGHSKFNGMLRKMVPFIPEQ
jgi:hypothetical protein